MFKEKLKEMIEELKLADTNRTINIAYNDISYSVEVNRSKNYSLVVMPLWFIIGNKPIVLVKDKDYQRFVKKVEKYLLGIENKIGICTLHCTKKGSKNSTLRYFTENKLINGFNETLEGDL